MMGVLLFFFACSDPTVLSALTPPLAEIVVTVADAQVASGEGVVVEVEVVAAEGWTVAPGIPFSEGLVVELSAEEGPVLVGERKVTSRRYALSGPDGSYVVGTTEGEAQGPEGQSRSFSHPPLFVDIGVEGPTGGAMDGFAKPPPKPEDKTRQRVAIAILLVALVALGLWWWRRRRARLNAFVPPPIAAHIVAQKEWRLARSTIAGDHPLALRLSMVLREYLESRSGFPASKATTVEIWAAMASQGIDGRPLSEGLRGHIGQILDATDRLKFAREGGGAGFFEQLDAHFEGIINQTRPLASEVDDA
jgi:hypothetical protein